MRFPGAIHMEIKYLIFNIAHNLHFASSPSGGALYKPLRIFCGQ